MLEDEVKTAESLAKSQQAYFNQRREELNNGAFSRLYTFDEYGQLKYNNSALGFKFLSDLMEVDDYGKPKYSAEEQYNIIRAAGFGDYMKYTSSGEEIKRDESSED